MKKEPVIINGGLTKLPTDVRDFNLGSLYKTLPVEEIPDITFSVESHSMRGNVKDQGDSDLCTAYTITSVSADQEEIDLSPEYQFAKIKQITGNIEEWGADLRSACKSATKFGSIPSSLANSYMKNKGIDSQDRSRIADYRNWGRELDDEAIVYSKDSFFSITGNDLFNKIRSALWANKHERRTIAVGALWRAEWTTAEGGVIPRVYGDNGFGHAFKIVGQRNINGEIYLTAKLSNGTQIGDFGYFYFPEEVVNKEFTYGAYMFKDIPPFVVKDHIKNDIKIDDRGIMKFIKRFLNIFSL